MNNAHKFFLIDEEHLPPVLLKVIEVRRLMQQENVQTINEAVKLAGLSRSAFYKYRDAVYPFYEKTRDRIITLHFLLLDEMGVLSNLLMLLARVKANIMTINQNIPLNGIAPVSVSIRTGQMEMSTEELYALLSRTEGITSVDIISSE